MKTPFYFLSAFFILTSLILSACAPAPLPTAVPSLVTPTPKVHAFITTTYTDAATGKNFSLQDFRGKVVIVEFIATWCPTCFKEARELKTIRDTYSAEDLEIVSLGLDFKESPADLSSYASQFGFNWHFALANMEATRDIGNSFGALYIDPTAAPILILSRTGEVIKMNLGFKKAEDIIKIIDPLIKARGE